ncbi:MAG TPA: efflux RND transporter periplasmic adaptor subunit [Spirochaetia bacterium]
MKRAVLIIVPIVIVVGVAGAWFFTRPKTAKAEGGQSYQLTTVTRGSIESVVSSSGTLSPISEVSVLAQMSGRLEKVNVDYNDRVKKGQVLAEINTDMLRLQELESEAAVKKAQANYDLYKLAYDNNVNLYKKGLVSEYDFKSSETNLHVYAADLASAQAALKVIQTELNQYALITAPITGIVIDKNVDVGQSVVEGSSSNATSLFTLSEDLAKMEIKAQVDELDISSIKVGQAVRFTVEANPGVTYDGTVSQIRLVPETTNNVVNYYVIINAPNKDGSLLPGMTANVEFIKEKKTNVAVVPTAALRFQPTTLNTAQIAKMEFLAGLDGLSEDERVKAEKAYDERIASAAQAAGQTPQRAGGLAGMMMPGPPRRNNNATNGRGGQQQNGAQAVAKKPLWYVGSDGKLGVYMVQTGTSDGTNTEIVGADALIGKQVILKVKVE